MTSLNAYFLAMNELLKGDISPPAFIDKMGDDTPTLRGLQQYQGACLRVPSKLLGEVYRCTKAFADQFDHALFPSLVDTHLARRPITSWQIFRIAEAFDESVAAHAENAPKLHPALVELADYEHARWVARTCPSFETPGLSADVFFMRRYLHAIPVFFNALKKNPEAKPQAGEQIWIVYREPREAKWGRFRPTPAQLLSVAVATGEVTPEQALAAGLTQAQLDEAHEALAGKGIVKSRS